MRNLSLWFISIEIMPELKEVVDRVSLPLQFSLGICQIMKATPLWAVIHCTIAFLLDCIHFPYTDYKQLNECEGCKGRVFKKVISHATTAHTTTAGGLPPVTSPEAAENSKNQDEIKVSYLKRDFCLKRIKENRTVMECEIHDEENGSTVTQYYITDEMWESLFYIGKVAQNTVFVKNHKELWEEVITGDIMSLPEVLDSVILDNHAVIRLHHDYFLPVNLLLAEDKLLKALNFLGLFLQTQKHIHWLIPALLSFTSAVMGFSTEVRLFIDSCINTILCRPVQMLCDLMPLAMRRRAYCWGNWVENLKPSNDLQSKIVSGSICVLVAGGAKAHSESLTPCKSLANHVILAERGNRRGLVGGSAKADLEILVDCKSFAALLSGGAKPQLEPLVDSESLAKQSVNEILSKGVPFLFKCDSKCGLKCISKCDSVYIEWIFDNTKCWLKAGRVASQESLIPLPYDFYVVCDDSREEDIKLFTCASCYGKEEDNNSVIVDDIDTASVDVECSREEAIKLFKLAFYMAQYKSGSLKSVDRDNNTVYVRRFVESINAYARSRYPPLHKLDLKNVVVR